MENLQDFSNIKHILIDVDHTLYPRSSGIEIDMIKLINKFVAGYLGITEEEAAEMRATRPPIYDSTLDWLQRTYNFTDTTAFFSYIHPTDLWHYFPKNPELVEMMRSIKIPCSIFTNSWHIHAENVTNYLEITPFFKKIYDLPFFKFKCKPNLEAFTTVLDDLQLPAEEILLVDDAPKNILAFEKIGGSGILVDEDLKPRKNFRASIIREITQLQKFKELF